MPVSLPVEVQVAMLVSAKCIQVQLTVRRLCCIVPLCSCITEYATVLRQTDDSRLG